MTDIPWTELNQEFGQHCISHHEECHTKQDDADDTINSNGSLVLPNHLNEFHQMEFDYDELDSTIILRGRSNISHSTGLTIWTCSQILSGFLLENPHYVKDQNVLELGAGVGLASIVAHHLGADSVLSTDGDVRVLENLRHNVRVNCWSLNQEEKEDQEDEEVNRMDLPVNNGAEHTSSVGVIHCPQLIWGKTLNEFREKYGSQNILLGTDIFYNHDCVEPIWKTVEKLLEQDGKFLLAFAPHKVEKRIVLEKAKEFGFTWIEPSLMDDHDDSEEDSYHANSCSFSYHVFVFQREDPVVNIKKG